MIRFFAEVNAQSINALLVNVDQQLQAGADSLSLLISSPGGSVFHGLTAYNYLRGIPVEATTHNIGSVDSIGVVIYCAGARRYSVPNARFMIHEVSMTMNGVFDERAIENNLKNLRIDMRNVAGVMAANTGKTDREVENAMQSHTTLNPEEALDWGLVHEIKPELYEPGTPVISIQ